MKKNIQIASGDDYEVYAREGYGPGSPAVKAIWGYSTGSELGEHNHLNTFAIAEIGRLDEDGEYESIEGAECDGWNPKGEDVDWDAYDRWITAYCESVL